MKRLRILQLVPEPLPTFRADVATLFGKYLPRHGVETHLVGKGSAAPLDGQGFASQRRSRIGARWKSELSFGWLCLRALLGAKRGNGGGNGGGNCDLIQVRDMVSIGLLALLIARIKRIPMAYWVSYLMSEGRIERARDDLARRGGLRARLVLAKGLVEQRLLYKFLLPRADHVFVQSEAMAALMASHGVPPSRLCAVPMGVDMETVTAGGLAPRQWKGWEGRPVIAYLGTLDRARCLDKVIEALALVRKQIPDACLLLIGSSPRTEDIALWLNTAEQRGVGDAVQVTGWLPAAEAWQYLLGAQAAVSYIPRGALYDVSSPTKLLEYLALGMPCVGNDTPDQAAVLAASGAGWLSASTAEAMADGLVSILRDPDAARRRAASGPNFIEAERSYRVLGEAVARRYHAVLGGEGHAV